MVNRQKKTSFFGAFKYAWSGIVATFKSERNFKVELGCAAFALVAAGMFALEPLEWAIIILLIVLVLVLELLNSALESLTDLASPAKHPLAKYVKDAMAGAVLLASIGSVVIGLIIFIHAGLRLWGA